MPFKQSDVCVTFDLWETLIKETPERELIQQRMRCEGMRQVLAESGVEVSVEDLLQSYDESAHWLQRIWKENRETTDLEQIRIILRAACAKNSDLLNDNTLLRRLKAAYSSPILGVPPSLCDHAGETLERVKENVARVGLISNVGRSPGKTLRQLMDRLGILHFFDATIFSDEIGWRKPDRRIFLSAAKALGTSPEQMIHIGDHPEADIWGAKEAGMRAILIEYEVPEAFKSNPSSLLSQSRERSHFEDSRIKPDGRVQSLREVWQAIESIR